MVKRKKEYRVGVCPECKVREGDSSKKRLYTCPYCGRYFCEKHLEPRLATTRSSIESIKDPVLREKVYEEWRKPDGHPDWVWTRQYFEKLERREEEESEKFLKFLDRLKEAKEEEMEKLKKEERLIETRIPTRTISKSEPKTNISFSPKFFAILVIVIGVLSVLLIINIQEIFGIEKEKNLLENELRSLQEEIDNLSRELVSVNEEIVNNQVTLNTTQEKISKINSLIETMNSSKRYRLHDPTYAEVIDFLNKDQTDKNPYSENYTCTYFARDVNNNAEKIGIRAAFVVLEFPSPPGHAIVAFNTTDRGLVYFEPQHDVEAHLEIGKRYYKSLEEIPGYYWPEPDYNDTIVNITIWW